MRAKGIQMLEAPVSGGVPRATDGTIVIMVGGDAAVFDAQLPLLKSFSGEVVHVGEIGMGSVAKLVNNMLAFCNAAAAAEALMIGTMAGIDLRKLQQVISNASGNSSAFRNISEKAFKREFAGNLRARPGAQGPAARAGIGRRTRRARHDRAAGDEPDAHRARQGHGRRRQQLGDPRLRAGAGSGSARREEFCNTNLQDAPRINNSAIVRFDDFRNFPHACMH